jgi:Zn-dependent M28 family amino/carboxypeptidase
MKRISVVVLVLLAACDVFSGPEATDPLTEEALLEHLNFLAGDSLYGRGSGTDYELEAAEYIRDAFDDYGLVPGVAGWLQSFTYITGLSPSPGAQQVGHMPEFGSSWAGELGTSGDGLEGVFLQEEATSQNVLGVLPGQGSLSEQWVILGAHYDHIGFTQVAADSIVIFNGADDNASGTSLLLELARYLSHYFSEGVARGLDRRSVMFLAFGAEEAGLVGSMHFVSAPTMPLDSVTAMVNLDMVGRLRGGELIAIGGSSSPLWVPLLTERNEEDLQIVIPSTTTLRSDHAPFYYEQIPVLFFYTGTHDQYHHPDDDVWLLNAPGMVRIGNLAIAVLTDLLVRPERPTFVY